MTREQLIKGLKWVRSCCLVNWRDAVYIDEAIRIIKSASDADFDSVDKPSDPTESLRSAKRKINKSAPPRR